MSKGKRKWKVKCFVSELIFFIHISPSEIKIYLEFSRILEIRNARSLYQFVIVEVVFRS